MAKTILLETRTTNFLELIGNGKIFRVPPYQRDYSWKHEQWEDLWNDIQALNEPRDDRHYMGALVIEGISDREFLIIDGQQRMAPEKWTPRFLKKAGWPSGLSISGDLILPEGSTSFTFVETGPGRGRC